MSQGEQKNCDALMGQIFFFEDKMVLTGWLLRKGLILKMVHY